MSLRGDTAVTHRSEDGEKPVHSEVETSRAHTGWQVGNGRLCMGASTVPYIYHTRCVTVREDSAVKSID